MSVLTDITEANTKIDNLLVKLNQIRDIVQKTGDVTVTADSKIAELTPIVKDVFSGGGKRRRRTNKRKGKGKKSRKH